MIAKRTTLEEKRLWLREQSETRPMEPWLWPWAINGRGYGQLIIDGKNVLAHRWAWAELVGAPPPMLDHWIHNEAAERGDCDGGPGCLHRRDVNPAHLRPTNGLDNQHASPLTTARKTHCPQGHPYDEANTYVYGRNRKCRACRVARQRRSVA